MTAPIARADLLADIAAVLDVPPEELNEDVNLLDAGLDSLRLMSLVEKWRSEGFAEADFVALASDPLLGSWIDVMAAA